MLVARRTWGGVALATLLAIGFLVIWLVAVAWIAATVLKRSGGTYERLVFLPSGEPAVMSFSLQWPNVVTLRTLSGRTLDYEKLAADFPYGIHLPARFQSDRQPSRLPWKSRMGQFSDGKQNPTLWHLVHDGYVDGHAFFVGYDQLTNALVGYIGTKGFRRERLPLSEHFPIPGVTDWSRTQVAPPMYATWVGARNTFTAAGADGIAAWEAYFNAQDRIYHVDLRQRRVSVAAHSPSSPFRSVGIETRRQGNRNNILSHVLFRADDQVLVTAGGKSPVTAVKLPVTLRQQDIVWLSLPAGAIAYTTQNFEERGVTSHQILWINAEGRLSKTMQVTLRNDILQPTPWLPLPLPCPVAVDAAYMLIDQPKDIVRWPGLVAVHLLGATLAAACFWHARRYATPARERAAWTIFVLLFGLPALVGYLAHRRWPVRLPCPNCARSAPRDRPWCAQCDREFPRPELRGIEIFA